MLAEFKSDKYVEEVPGEDLYIVIGLIAISIVETIVYVYMLKRNLKKLNKIKKSC